MPKNLNPSTISSSDYARGYYHATNQNSYTCLICNKEFTELKVYQDGDEFLTAKGAVIKHIHNEHKSVAVALTQTGRQYVGLSESLHQYASLLAKGLSDEEIASKLNLHPSTLRNYRHKLREKARQAKMLLALTEALELEPLTSASIHKGAKQVDDRYNFTEEEYNKVIKNYFTEEGMLTTFPAKAKKKIICLQHIIKHFQTEQFYTEAEVNRILKRIYQDFASIRRSLIEYGFMERSKDGKKYIRK